MSSLRLIAVSSLSVRSSTRSIRAALSFMRAALSPIFSPICPKPVPTARAIPIAAAAPVASGEIIGVLVQGRQARAGLPVILATPIDYLKYLVPVPTGEKINVEEIIAEDAAAEDGPSEK